MMLVLPVQTFASAATLGCAGSHQEMATHAMADDSMATCHESEQSDSSPATDTCKHCTACHTALALLVPAVDAAPVVPFAHNVIPHPDDAFTGFIPEGPERPPRASLA